ncbi:MAG: outer membrane protein assembly factor BamA [Leptospirillia bacterium]
MHLVFRTLILFVFLALSCGVSLAADESLLGRTVMQIDITGNREIETTTVAGAIRTKVGEPLSAGTVRSDVESVFALGFFRDVVVEAEALGDVGVAVRYRLTEMPVLGNVAFSGNRKVIEETLNEAAAGLNEGGLLASRDLARVRERILAQYEEDGFRRAKVVAVEELQTSPGAGRQVVNVTFVIDEGKKTKIREIEFAGNEFVTDRILKRQLKTGERFWLTSWLTDSGLYRASDVSEDLLRLEDFYQDRGFLDVEVDEPALELSEDREWLVLTYPVREGKRYQIGEVTYDHGGLVSEEDLAEGVSVVTGERYGRSQLRQDIGTITDHLGERGYAFAQVTPDLVPDPEAAIVNVRFRIDEGDRVRIRRINISGNTKTRDKVIRREVRQQEGEVINTSLLRRSFQRINNLNFFESVDIVPVEVGSGLLDLDVKVEEKSTGQFSVGGGYSSVDGLVGLVEITQGNFGGRGQTLAGRFERSGRRTVYNLRFREPYLLDTEYSAGFDVFKTERDFESYTENRAGGGVNMGKSLGEYTRGSLSYTYEVVDIDVTDPTVPAIIQDQDGTSTTSSIALSLSRDARDNFFDPRSGTRNVLRTEVAGKALGGTNDFVKTVLDSSVYFPLMKSSSLSFRNLFGWGTGIGDAELPPGERFFVGGISTVRGFDFGEAGPMAPNGDPIGADKEWVVSVEFSVPLIKVAKLKGALFMDWGGGFNTGQSIAASEMNRSWGYEIRWISPLGPLRFGYGWVLDDRRPTLFQRKGEQLFTIGTLF